MVSEQAVIPEVLHHHRTLMSDIISLEDLCEMSVCICVCLYVCLNFVYLNVCLYVFV